MRSVETHKNGQRFIFYFSVVVFEEYTKNNMYISVALLQLPSNPHAVRSAAIKKEVKRESIFSIDEKKTNDRETVLRCHIYYYIIVLLL